jgi:FKBP-type peptidyl-prolyl cis-trans isomerase
MKRFLFFSWILLSLVGCDTTDHPGFERKEGSVHYRLITLGDEDRKITPESYITLNVHAFDTTGKALAKKRLQRLAMTKSEWPRHLSDLLRTAAEGDSLELIGSISELQANDWFRPVSLGENTEMVLLKIAVLEVLDVEEILQIRAEERAKNDSELQELARFKSALDSLGFDMDDREDGIFFRSMSKGKGKKPQSGNEIIVRYRAYLSDGTLIDDTYQGDALHYIMGKPDQVLPGFGLAMSRMSEGERALFILPSDQAFGEKGSSSGIVPPFAALIYEAELIEVRG